MGITDLKSAYATATSQVVATGDQVRIFGVSVSRANGENSKLIFKTGGASGTAILTFECGAGTEPYMFMAPSHAAIRFADGLHVTFEGSGNPNSITVLYQ